jgi:spermidine synthase
MTTTTGEALTEPALGDRTEPAAAPDRGEALALLGSIFLVAACGLIYELLIATVSSYLLGSSVTQFSLSIGMFVGSMGLGSWLSQRVRKNLLGVFVTLELVLAVVGGVSASALYWAYATGPFYWVVLLGFLIVIGALVGIELPLLVRSLLFPLVLLPAFGVSRTAFLVGLVNVGVAVYALRVFSHRFRSTTPLVISGIAAVLLTAGLANSVRLTSLFERRLYDDEIILARQTPYQRIVLTRWRDDLRLYLDGNLQFSSTDEHRYHETLIHPAMGLSASRGDVLLLGGGDGLGVREVLRWPEVRSVTLVDLDPEMTKLGRTYPAVREQNRHALDDPRVKVINTDAHAFLERTAERFGVIVADLPDPNGDALAKLYSVEFYRLARRHLSPGGVFVTQASSPFFSRDAFWCTASSVEKAGFHTLPIHTYVPSFGDWGFVLAAERDLKLTGDRLPPGLRYLSPEVVRTLPVFDGDTSRVPVEPSTVDHPRIIHYYLNGARRWDGA